MGLKISTLSGYKKKDAFGYAVAIGDLNGDKINEVIIASTNSIKGGTITIYSSTTFKRLKTIYIGKKKINTIRLLIMDINNDNVSELIVAVTYQDLSGEVKIYSYKKNKVISQWKSVNEHDAFGFAIAAGDTHGDGNKNIVISAPQPVENGKGKVYIYSTESGELLREFTSIVTREYSDYGSSLACSDINNDGIDEVIIGAPGIPKGEVLIFSGKYGWLVHKLTGNHSGFGINVFAEDINEDNEKELIVTTKNLNGNKVSVFNNGQLLYEIENDDVDIGFGETIAVGDVNGDGKKELILGAFDSHHRLKKYTGQVNIYDGREGKLIHRWFGKTENDQFGFSLCTGKLKNESKDSLLIGTPREIGGKRGKVYITSID